MAEQSVHDAVDQAQSAGGPSPADVSATKSTDSAAPAAVDNATILRNPDNLHTLPDSTPEHMFADPESLSDLLSGTSENDKPYANNPENLQKILEPSQKVNGVRTGEDYHDSESAEDLSSQHAVGDDSVGSDTDTGKFDIADTTNKDSVDNHDHIRSNSIRKPATFKAVSVTKSFLAKAGTASAPTGKNINEKANTPGTASSVNVVQSAPRPRLVAKSASGHRALAPKSIDIGSKIGKGSGPDPNQVWNRNRVAAPQATPKHLTDEELKQQYGIHLASRLQEDGDGKEAKWADIDDDEDDWAPETIEWNDGTKITLSQNDTGPALGDEPITVVPVKEKADYTVRPKLNLAKPTTTVGPNATVLKLGSAVQPKSGGLVLKGPSDKPTLVAKPSVPTAVKSPWASLPPVDKVSPVPVNPPTQASLPRFSQKDPHGFDAMPPPPSPAKEIAADDFTRSWRETQNGIPRELFNSQSGRYEPVNDTRRGSMRKDQNFRPPALLQRPSQSDPHGPAEPSAAFQTNRSGGQQEQGPYNRRRNSSNLSGDSGNQGRRMSLSKGTELARIPTEIHEQRRNSQREQSPLTPGNPPTRYAQRDVSPAQTHNQLIASQSPTVAMSQLMTANDSALASPQQSQVGLSSLADSNQDAIAVQKKLMREKREMAIKRKKEEEEREEAEKRERIRLKMEMLGLPPLDDKKGKKEAVVEVPSSPAQPQDEILSASRSPPKPPVPDVSGEPKQYGMMKVHAPTKNGVHPGIEAVRKTSVQSPVLNEKLPSPIIEVTDNPANDTTAPLVNGVIDQISTQASAPKSPELHLQDHLSNPIPQPWKEAQQGPNGFPNWGTASMTTHSSPGGNLWGPPSSHNRALGNGDFNRSIQRPQSRQPQYHQHVPSPAPQPIGPPKPNQQAPGSQAQFRPSDTGIKPTSEESQTMSAFPSPDSVPAALSNQMRGPQNDSEPKTANLIVGSAAPSTNNSADRVPRINDSARSGLSAWANFHVTSAKENEKAAQDLAARLMEEKRSGTAQDFQLPIMNETWRQVKINEQVGQRQVVGALKTQSIAQDISTDQQIHGDDRITALPKPANIGPVAGVVRSSRFFPAAQAIPPQGQRSISLNVGFVRSTSPPPPDSVDHPAFAGIPQRPLVKIPFIKPKPTVRLPPSFTTPIQSPVMTEIRALPLRAVSQPLVNNPSWQERINGLFGRKPSPEKKFAHVAEFSTSKTSFEVASMEDPTSVSLPPKEAAELSVDIAGSGEVESKAVEEEDELFEERDFGSVPTVLIPPVAPAPLWQPARTPKSYRLRSKLIREIETISVRPFVFGLDEKEHHHSPNGVLVTIRVPGPMATTKFKVMPRYNGHGAPRNQPSQQPLSPQGRATKGLKSRETSATYGKPKPTQSGPMRTSSQTGPNIQPKIKSYTNNVSWARRASGVVQ